MLPDSCIPQLSSDFVGRSEECEAVIKSLMSKSTRMFSIWGSPGFGKTSTAIAIGNQLKSQGKNVYYFSFRGVSTMKEFTSKLLGLFGRSIDLHPCVNLAPTDQLLYAFGRIKAQMFVILDNLDDILTSSSEKEAMLNFIISVLHRIACAKLLTTTRESLEYINLRVQEFDSIRLKSLDPQSSASFVLKLLPQLTTADLQSQISKMCGNVPLAIRLLCSLIKDNPQEYLDEILNGSECLLDVIDDDGFPPDSSLNELIQILFNKLSDVEKKAFISLTLFGGAEFGLDAGIAIVGGSKLHAKRSIESLKKKSLIDVDGETCAIHPLIQSFALKKGQNEMKNVQASSKDRFLEYYINLFQRLNMRFLTGDSLSAFKTFYMEEHRISSSLMDGLDHGEFLVKVVSILKECEFFLDGLYNNSFMKMKHLYNSALSKVSDTKFGKDFAGLYSSRQYLETTLINNTFTPIEHEDDETRRKILLLPFSVQGKLECYKGIYELSNGGGEPAAQRIEAGLLQLDNNPQHIILKVLGFQFLAIYHNCMNNFVKCEQFRNQTVETCTVNSVFCYVPLLGKPVENDDKLNSSCLKDLPLAAWAIARLSLWTRKYPWVKLGTGFGNSLHSFLKQISSGSSKPVGAIESCTLLQLVDKAYIYLGIPFTIDTAILSEYLKYQDTKDEDEKRHLALLLEREAEYYHALAVAQLGKGQPSHEFLLKELEIRRHFPLDAKLAQCYKFIGMDQKFRREYASAVESFKASLQTFEKLHGEMHEEVAKSYCCMADAQDNMGNSESSIRLYRSALKIFLNLYGNFHPHPLSQLIEERINCLSKCTLVHSRCECRQKATKLYEYTFLQSVADQDFAPQADGNRRNTK